MEIIAHPWHHSQCKGESKHTIAIWTFTFHKISGFERVILKVNFNSIYRQKLSILSSENAGLFHSFFFYSLQNLSNPVLFTYSCCCSKELTCLNCYLMQKSQFKHVNSLEQQRQCVKSTGFTNSAKNRRKMSKINLHFQIIKLIVFVCRLDLNLPSKSPFQSLIFCEM